LSAPPDGGFSYHSPVFLTGGSEGHDTRHALAGLPSGGDRMHILRYGGEESKRFIVFALADNSMRKRPLQTLF